MSHSIFQALANVAQSHPHLEVIRNKAGYEVVTAGSEDAPKGPAFTAITQHKRLLIEDMIDPSYDVMEESADEDDVTKPPVHTDVTFHGIKKSHDLHVAHCIMGSIFKELHPQSALDEDNIININRTIPGLLKLFKASRKSGKPNSLSDIVKSSDRSRLSSATSDIALGDIGVGDLGSASKQRRGSSASARDGQVGRSPNCLQEKKGFQVWQLPLFISFLLQLYSILMYFPKF